MEIKKEEIFSVSEVNRLVKNVIDTSLPMLWIEGEVANFVRHTSGHIYFTLKDKNSTIKCAFFRNYNMTLTFSPKNGDKVICYGKIDVYEPTGTYQLIARNMMAAGIGDLQLKFLALKKKLEEEGLFSTLYKKSLPQYPEKIGVITSATGAAFQDIKNVITRRYPHQLYLYPAAVQGSEAVPELIAGLNYFNEQFAVDVIIIGRGGGSQEDLFCFNDESLARAIFASKIPVISAVGHEIDFTIADFAADVRAPTPSAAAEIAVPNKDDLLHKLTGYHKHLDNRVQRYILGYKNSLAQLEKSLLQWHPRKVLYQNQQRLDDAITAFNARLQEIANLKHNLQQMESKLVHYAVKSAGEKIHQKQLLLEALSNRLINSAYKVLSNERIRLDNYNENLKSLSPQQALKRGYGIIRKERKIVSSVSDVEEKDNLEVMLRDGSLKCLIEEIFKN